MDKQGRITKLSEMKKGDMIEWVKGRHVEFLGEITGFNVTEVFYRVPGTGEIHSLFRRHCIKRVRVVQPEVSIPGEHDVVIAAIEGKEDDE